MALTYPCRAIAMPRCAHFAEALANNTRLRFIRVHTWYHPLKAACCFRSLSRPSDCLTRCRWRFNS